MKLACAGLAAICMLAAPVNGQDEATEEDVFELSPFLVESGTTGWTATETLAGSRMRTNLGDVATQVEVMTLDFMDDY